MENKSGNDTKSGLLIQAKHYWQVIQKWRWTALFFFVAVFFSATLYSFIVTPLYTSHGSVWIEDDPKILPFEDVQSLGAGTSLQSHVQLLQSKTLAADTIDKLKLYENPDFAGKPKKGEKADPADPIRRELLIRWFLEGLSVTPVPGTSLVNVSYTNRNPNLAANALNALFNGYIDMIVRKRYSASEKASEFLNAQISELRTDIETRERELNQYGSEKNILPLTAAEAPTISKIGEINRKLTEATLYKVNKLNYYNQLKSAPFGEIPNAPEGSLIQRLREQYITLNRQYATRLSTVRPEYPEMQRLKSELDSATAALQSETQNLIRIAYGEYQAAFNAEQSLQRLLSEQKNEAYKANSSSVIYNSLKIELDNRKALLESLSKRQSETGVSSQLKGLEALNVWIVDKADYPLKATFPNKKMNVMVGFLFGLLGGIGLAIVLDYLDHTVRTSKDVIESTGYPTLGAIPTFKTKPGAKRPGSEFARLKSMLRGTTEKNAHVPKNKRSKSGSLLGSRFMLTEEESRENYDQGIELIAAREPQSIQAESYRSIRTTLLVSAPPGRIKTLLFTSPLAREGKSSTVSNLAITLAEANRKVIIVDSDLRKPKQARLFGLHTHGRPGLSQFLSSQIEPSDIIEPTALQNLQLIPSGPPPANPVELLTSERMDNLVAYLKRNFDFAFFDAPPILAVSDALALGPMVDAIVLIARGGQTPIPAMKQAKQRFESHKLRCLGVILNEVDLFEQDGYYASQYYQYSKND